MSKTTKRLKIVSRIVDDSNLILTPPAAAATHLSYTMLIKVMVAPIGSAVTNASCNVSLTPSVWGAQFLGNGVPLISMFEGFLTSLRAILNIINHDDPKLLGLYFTYICDFLSGLPLMIKGYSAWNAATWPLSLTIAAHGYAIKAGYDFLRAGIVWLCDDEGGEKLAKKRQNFLLQGLKFAGFLCLSFGPAGFTAGFILLAVAAATSVYEQSKTVQNIANSTFSFFARCISCIPCMPCNDRNGKSYSR